MAIRVRLSRVLGEKRIKAAELSRRTGVSKYALHKLYHEKNKGIEFVTLEKLCQALDCSVGDLLEYVPDAEKNPLDYPRGLLEY
jgi:putative transcriptional regulator